MKKTIAASLSLIALGLFASTEVSPDTLLGLTKISDSRKYLPIAIIYDEAGGSGTSITVADVIQTSTLTAGDYLYAYDHSSQHYNRYRLTSDLTWKEISYKDLDDNLIVSTPAASTRLDKGHAIWLIRNTSTDKPVYTIGQLATSATVTVSGGVKAAYTLLSTPNEIDLSTTNVFGTNPVALDKIALLLSDGTTGYYRYRSGKWSIWSSTGLTSLKIPAGSVFWYIRKAAAPSFNVSWNF